MKKLIVILLFLSDTALAQFATTLKMDVQTGATVELGYRTQNKLYSFASISYMDWAFFKGGRAEVGLAVPVSEDRKHNLGISGGFLFINEARLFSNSFEKEDTDVIALKYMFFSRSSSTSSFRMDIDYLFIEGGFHGPGMAFGYQFQF